MDQTHKKLYITDSWDWEPVLSDIARVFVRKEDVPILLETAERSGFQIVPAVREHINEKSIRYVTERKKVRGKESIGRGIVLVFYVNSDRERKIRVCLNW